MGYGGKLAARTGDVRRFNFTGNGSNTAFGLGFAPASPNQLIVTINGVVQHYDAFSVTGSTLTFTGTPSAGDTIQVTAVVDAIGVMGIADGAVANVSTLRVTTTPLLVGNAVGTFSNPLIQAASTANSWVQINAQNLNNGNNASTDLVLARSDGSDTAGYIDVGINSNTYSQAAYSIMTPNSGYMFTNGGDLFIGTQTAHSVVFHTGNTTSSSERMRITSNGAVAFPDGTQFNTAGSFGMRNRVINGAMLIAQRNANTSATATVNSTSFGIHDADRFNVGVGNTAVVTTQRSTDVPAGQGFQYSKKITVTTASTSTGRYAEFSYNMEAQDTMNMGWDAYSPTSFITVSFWAKSSLAGTYVAQIRNRRPVTTRAFSYYYTLAANTWTKISFQVPGDASGTWYNDNGEGLTLWINADTGSDFTNVSSPTGSWFAITATNYYQPYSQQWCATVGNTFNLTGVQIERGTVSTPFDFRPIGTELSLCQRYCQVYTNPPLKGVSQVVNAAYRMSMVLPVQMRSAPSTTIIGNFKVYDASTTALYSSIAANYSTINHIEYDFALQSNITVSRPVTCYYGDSFASFILSSEL